MSHWWKYPISDVLPFSLRSYYRLLESYGQEFWLLYALSFISGLVIIWRLTRFSRLDIRITLLYVAVGWALVAWLFFHRSYSSLFWAAPYFAIAFAAQCLVLAVMALLAPGAAVSRAGPPRCKLGAALFALVLLAYPLAGFVLAAAPAFAEGFAMTPDPTAIGTLAILSAMQGRLRWIAMVIPLVWSLVSTVILWNLGSALATAIPVLCALAIIAALAPDKDTNHTDYR
ncbi:MAG: hypothetical protein KKB37_04100 [Alphaproteobacteria bacterium]|nr:hypothetical protein [Alphaproteobacteria bacterium]